ncbi:MAG: hypothetical protein RJA70_3183 [Pseudomonadota bacterium]|jgi:branched-chain amino acid transport system ATP-binding protein
MSSDILLSVQDLRVAHGSIEVLHGICLELQAGEITALIGANGAGKTTTLSTISGTLAPRSGSIRFRGSDITGLPTHQTVGLGIAHSPEGRRVFSRLTILENLELGAYVRRDAPEIRRDIDRMFEMFPILSERKAQLAGTLSGGEQQMLAVARALMSRPKLLLLDEPSLGLAPLIVAKIFERIRDLTREGISVLLVEQNARLALDVSARAYVLETGNIVLSGVAQDLLKNERVQSAYLGE